MTLSVLAVSLAASCGAYAASCPVVGDPQGLVGAFPQQVEVEEAAAAGVHLKYSDNPLFAEDVKAGRLAPVAQRLPEEPLIELPYEDCGVYGGTLTGSSLTPSSGTSDFESWRQVSLVRISDDLQTIVPNVAKSWKWNDDYTAITFELRKGHKWSDGQPFTADDVVFFFEDIVNNKELNPQTTQEWGVDVHAEKIDAEHVKLSFARPFPGLLTYMATGGSYFTPFAPKHYFSKFHIKYNPNASVEAKQAGLDDWAKRFNNIYNKKMFFQVLTATGLEIPTLESHVLEVAPDGQRRLFKANPYYFKVDSAGQQLPYADHQQERFLNVDLQTLAMLNGEMDFKAQNVDPSAYPTLREGEEKGHYSVLLPTGAIGPHFAVNITHSDPKLRSVYGDVRFREAISLAINRAEVNEVIYFGLAKPGQAMPVNLSFAKESDVEYMADYDVAKANQLLDEMGMKRGGDGYRNYPDGSEFTILWEYSQQFATPEFVKLMTDYIQAVGLRVNAKEVSSETTRINAKAGTADFNMEWDTPFEPNLIANIDLYVPPYSDTSPLFGTKWKQWNISNGASGEEPPDWAKKMFAIAKEWRTVVPGSPRYEELGRELIKLNLDNMTIIGTVGNVPKPVVATNSLGNLKRDMVTIDFNFGYLYPFRAELWYRRQ